MSSYVIGIEDDAVVVSFTGRDGRDAKAKIESVEGFHEFLRLEAAALGVPIETLQMFESSSMHFPADSTSKPEVIALAKELGEWDLPTAAPEISVVDAVAALLRSEALIEKAEGAKALVAAARNFYRCQSHTFSAEQRKEFGE